MIFLLFIKMRFEICRLNVYLFPFFCPVNYKKIEKKLQQKINKPRYLYFVSVSGV